MLTTNLAFADWHTIFPSATCATALVERVVHHADIVKIEGESYRLRESEVAAKPARLTTREEADDRNLASASYPPSAASPAPVSASERHSRPIWHE